MYKIVLSEGFEKELRKMLKLPHELLKLRDFLSTIPPYNSEHFDYAQCELRRMKFDFYLNFKFPEIQ